jgi:hypothetical protein
MVPQNCTKTKLMSMTTLPSDGAGVALATATLDTAASDVLAFSGGNGWLFVRPAGNRGVVPPACDGGIETPPGN